MNPIVMHHTPAITDRLPNIGTTIFTTMSQLAAQHSAVNLGQGFPDFECDTGLIDAVSQAMRAGHNQYPPMIGVAPLRQAISHKVSALYGAHYDADKEITITAGATQAILTVILCCVRPGDEVIVLEPNYDSYEPNIRLAGGQTVYVPLNVTNFSPDFGRIKAAITPRTRAIIINSPHNPSGRVWSHRDMDTLADILRDTNVLVICDEVYEHMVFDGERHQSVSRNPELAARSFVISSFGKTFHVTGWKVGYVAAPAAYTALFRKVHQFNVFTVNTPMQLGIASYLSDPKPYMTLPHFYQAKRDRFRAGLAKSSFELLPCEGTYFQCVSYAKLQHANASMTEQAFCEWLTRDIGVAAIPLSAFYCDARQSQRIRFCFAKRDETLDRALEKLRSL